MVCGRSLCVCFGPKCTHLIVIGFSVKHNLLLIVLSFSTIGSISTGEFIWNVRPAPAGLVTDKPELFISFSLIRLTSACSSPAGAPPPLSRTRRSSGSAHSSSAAASAGMPHAAPSIKVSPHLTYSPRLSFPSSSARLAPRHRASLLTPLPRFACFANIDLAF
jgi:hypothetical protein